MFIRPIFLSNEKVLSISKSLSLSDVKEVEESLVKNVLKRFPISWGSDVQLIRPNKYIWERIFLISWFYFYRIGIKFPKEFIIFVFNS